MPIIVYEKYCPYPDGILRYTNVYRRRQSTSTATSNVDSTNVYVIIFIGNNVYISAVLTRLPNTTWPPTVDGTPVCIEVQPNICIGAISRH